MKVVMAKPKKQAKLVMTFIMSGNVGWKRMW